MPIPVLSQTHPLHVLLSYSFKIHFNTILTIHLALKRGIIYMLQIPDRNPCAPFLSPSTCHKPRPSPPPYFIAQIIFGENKPRSIHYEMFSILLLLSPVRPKYQPQHPILERP